MLNIKQIRRRIRSVKSTQQITRVMEMVSASKLARTQALLRASKPYADGVEAILSRLSAGREVENPFITPREVKRRALMVVTSDRGLCGAYNTNVITHAENLLAKHDKATWRLICVGKKSRDYFQKRGWDIGHTLVETGGRANPARCQELAKYITDAYLAAEFDEVHFAYTAFKSVASVRPMSAKFLPIEPAAVQPVDYIFEPDPQTVLDKLVPEYIASKLFVTIIESFASEHGARMVAMRNATENAEEMIAHLTLVRNKARQAAITKELSEIVGTAEAIK
ncbi:MAG: ATP synthase F1 subunit gamma [Planctomycetes bacterium]|nr:ATP synthase F1 subunit gamma [Planctomycetota bacterium]